MESLNYPSILKFIGYSPVNFENEAKPTIVTEYASNRSLQNVIDNVSNYKNWNETKRLIVIYGIVAGMTYLHENSILHNDLKPSNVLLDENLYPKIADFGLSRTIAKVEDFPNKSINIKGTPSYIAPEIWDDQNYSAASDVYSFGILLYELVFMERSFPGLKPIQIWNKVANNKRPQLPFFNSNVFKSLIERF